MTLPRVRFRKPVEDKVPGFAVVKLDGTYMEFPDAQNAGNDTERRCLWIKDQHGEMHEFPYGTVDGFGRIDFIRWSRKKAGRSKK